MKNFIFPQIFQPVLEDSSLNIATQWHMTTRRIQTQMEINYSPHKASKMTKSSRQNLVIDSKHIVKRNSRQDGQHENSGISSLANGYENTRRHFQGPDQIQERVNNTTREAKIRVSPSRKVRIGKQQLIVSKKQTKMHTNTMNPKQNNNKQKGNKAQSKPIKREETQIDNQLKTKQKKSKKQGVKVSFGLSNKKIWKSPSQRTLGKSQNSINGKSKKSIEGDNISVRSTSSKRFVQKEKRRFGIEKSNIQVAFEATSDIKKIIQNNQKLLQLEEAQTRIKGQFQEQKGQQEWPNVESKLEFQNEAPPAIIISDKKTRNKTYHAIEGEKQAKHHKRSYTIWDIKGESSDEQKVTQQNKNPNEEKGANQKKKKKMKKVHFGRTSIQEKAGTNKTLPTKQIQIGIRSKLVGVPKRSKENNESLMDITEQSDKKTRKMHTNTKIPVKKGNIVRKQQVQNVYNELNYFRMRINALGKCSEEQQVTKPIPQAILFSVDKVLHELEYERIQRTKLSNRMIDFGVKLTRDCMLKQAGIKQRIIKCVI